MPRRYDAVFFDAGHTILEPVVPIPAVYQEEAAALQIQVEEGALRAHLERTWADLHLRSRSEGEDQSSSEAREAALWYAFTKRVAAPFPDLNAHHELWLARLVARFNRPLEWRVIPGAREALSRCREAGLYVALVSNWHRALHEIMTVHELTPAFDIVLISSEVGVRKPHPEIFRRALHAAGAPAARSCHVGDSWPEDVRGAIEVGITPIWIQRGAPPPEALAVHRISSIAEMRSVAL